MIYGSVCSGIEAASVAWKAIGWECAFMSEIEPFPRAVLAHHYEDTPLHGDFTTIRADRYRPINVLVGGTPCQSFSVAGMRGGMEDERGNLALEYLRLADRLRPRWLVWENVPGVRSNNLGRDLGTFLGGMGELGYGWAYASLDAQYFGLAQRRERVFVVGYSGDWRYPAEVLFEPASMQRHPAPSRKAGKGVASTITGGSGKRGWSGDNGCGQGCELIAYGGNNTGGPIDVATACRAKGGSGHGDFESETFVLATTLRARDGARGVDSDCTDTLITHALCADGFDTSEDGTGRGTPLVTVAHTLKVPSHGTTWRGDGSDNLAPVASGVRRLMPIECERLQGFPDGYTDIVYRGKPAADGPRYRALGNSMPVPVMRWIGQRIAATEATA